MAHQSNDRIPYAREVTRREFTVQDATQLGTSILDADEGSALLIIATQSLLRACGVDDSSAMYLPKIAATYDNGPRTQDHAGPVLAQLLSNDDSVVKRDLMAFLKDISRQAGSLTALWIWATGNHFAFTRKGIQTPPYDNLGNIIIMASDPKFEWTELLKNGMHISTPPGGYENVPRLLTVAFKDGSAPARQQKMIPREAFVVSLPTGQDRSASIKLKYRAGMFITRSAYDSMSGFIVAGMQDTPQQDDDGVAEPEGICLRLNVVRRDCFGRVNKASYQEINRSVERSIPAIAVFEVIA